jgi:hypothetical protein
LVKNM